MLRNWMEPYSKKYIFNGFLNIIKDNNSQKV